PDERLSAVFPEQFAAYCEHFIDFFPSLPYHVKTTYDTSSRSGGWVQKKSRNTGQPPRLIDGGNWLNRTSTVERHLDQQQWQWYHEVHDIGFRPTEFFWLGLHMPKKTRFHAIDADNKRRIAWYGEGTAEDPLMPVMEMPL